MTAYANTLKHFRFARESVFGSVGSGSPVPDISGATLIAVPVDSGGLARFGGAPVVEDTTVRVGHAPRPPMVDSAWDVANSRWYDRGPAEVSCTLTLRNFGSGSTNVTSSAEMFLAEALATLLHVETAATGSVTVTGAGANAGQAEVSAALSVGELVMVVIAGRAYINRVTDYTAGVATFLQYFPSALATNAVIYRGTTLSATSGANVGGVRNSLILEVAATAGASVGTGCVLTECVLTYDRGLVKAALKFSTAYSRQVDGPILVVAPEFQATSYDVTGHNSCARYGTAVTPTTPPASVTSGELKKLADGFTITIAATPTAVNGGPGCDLVAMGGMITTALTCSVTYTTHDPVAAIEADFLAGGRQRSYVFPFGPVATGNGMGVVIGAAQLTEEARIYDIAPDLSEQTVKLVAGPYQGDTVGGDPPENADFAFFICGV